MEYRKKSPSVSGRGSGGRGNQKSELADSKQQHQSGLTDNNKSQAKTLENPTATAVSQVDCAGSSGGIPNNAKKQQGGNEGTCRHKQFREN